jgi:hypothetical protein
MPNVGFIATAYEEEYQSQVQAIADKKLDPELMVTRLSRRQSLRFVLHL